MRDDLKCRRQHTSLVHLPARRSGYISEVFDVAVRLIIMGNFLRDLALLWLTNPLLQLARHETALPPPSVHSAPEVPRRIIDSGEPSIVFRLRQVAS